MRLPRSIKRASLGPEGPGSVLCRARGHRLAGQRPAWPVVSQKSTPQGRRGCGLLDIATHRGSRPGQAALTEKFQGHSHFLAEQSSGISQPRQQLCEPLGLPVGWQMLSRNPGVHLPFWQGDCGWRMPLERATVCNDGNPLSFCTAPSCRPRAQASQVSWLTVQFIMHNVHFSNGCKS